MLEEKLEEKKVVNIRLGARMKNAALAGARKKLKLNARLTAKLIGVSYTYYLNVENGRFYPSKDYQTKICDFFAGLGVFLEEEKVFPEEMKTRTKRTRNKTAFEERLVSLSDVQDELLPTSCDINIARYEDIGGIEQALRGFREPKKAIIRMRYGLDDNPPRTQKEIAEIFGLTRSRVGDIEEHVFHLLRRHPGFKEFRDCFYGSPDPLDFY